MNDKPVKARIVFEGMPSSLFSNETTGNISLTMPNVAYKGKEVFISAILPTGLEDVHTILVKNNTVISNDSMNKLYIHIASNQIVELEEFTVSIKMFDGTPVENARVTFMDYARYTDVWGQVNFTAPNVIWDIAREIEVFKPGFQSDFDLLIIQNEDVFQFWFLVGSVVVIMLIGVYAYFKFHI